MIRSSRPPRAEEKRRAFNSTLPAPTKPLKSSGRIKPKKRKPSEFARVYGSKERVAWVWEQTCVYCAMFDPVAAASTRGRCDNAHVETDGMGRKASYDRIVPMCRSHHRAYDERRAPLASDFIRARIQSCAETTQAAWLAYSTAALSAGARKEK